MKRNASVVDLVDSDEESDSGHVAGVVPVVSLVDDAATAFECRAQAYGLDTGSFQSLCAMGCPAGFFNILFCLSQRFGTEGDLRCIDGFAGVGRIFNAFCAAGLPSVQYDKDHDPVLQNILGEPGFLTLIQWCRRLKAFNSFGCFGILCSSWIFMCRNSTGRRPYNVSGERSDGTTTRSVRDGNTMVSRMVLILMFLMVRGVIWCVEQPQSSLLFDYFRMVQLRNQLKLYKCAVWLGAYGGESAKLINVLSNHQMVYSLYRKLNRQTFVATASAVVVPAPCGGVSGGPDLTASQTYPTAFAEALLSAYLKADPAELRDGFLISADRVAPQLDDFWEDARLNEVCEYLGVPHDRLLV